MDNEYKNLMDECDRLAMSNAKINDIPAKDFFIRISAAMQYLLNVESKHKEEIARIVIRLL